MKRIVLILLVCLAVAPKQGALACTSFAVYGDNGPIYGMNFDYPAGDYVLRYGQAEGCHEILTVSSSWDGNAMIHTPMMNAEGLFTTVQELRPRQPYKAVPAQGQESIANLAMWTPYVFGSVQGVRELLAETEISNAYGSFHSLYADASGDGMVLEVLDGERVTTGIEGRFIVMTNFPNGYLAATPLADLMFIAGGGADRYTLACDYISQHAESFTAQAGMTALALAMNENPYYPTQYSLVFDQGKGVIYLAIQGDYEHIWEIDMAAHTVMAYKGFKEPIMLDIGQEGIALKELAFRGQ